MARARTFTGGNHVQIVLTQLEAETLEHVAGIGTSSGDHGMSGREREAARRAIDALSAANVRAMRERERQQKREVS